MLKEKIKHIFSQTGPLAKAMPNYEVRPEQIEMALDISEAISNSDHLIVEAGTGVGKSFSYLIPVAFYTSEYNVTAIISTNTISLQEQIIHKDIPFLEKALQMDFKAVLVKGRHNYLCLRRLHSSNFKQKDLFSDEYEMGHFARIFAWSYKTKDGSLYDMEEQPDPKVWSMVSSDSQACHGKRCTYYKDCFFKKAREKIQTSRILVVNHHLFFSDFALGEDQKDILPDSDIVIFDEAHNIESVATEHLGINVSNVGLRHLLELLFNPTKQKGFLLSIGDHDSMEWVEIARKRSDIFFKKIGNYFLERRSSNESDSLRIKRPGFIENELAPPLLKLSESLINAKHNANTKEDELELSGFIKKINAFNNSIEFILNQKLEGYVYWIEYSRDKKINKVSLNAAPINIGPILKERLFSLPRPIIFTSATLSVEGDTSSSPFRYFKNRIGLSDIKEKRLGSSFDYKNQVRMYISKDMPNPDNLMDYSKAVAESLKRYIGLTNGNAFILFTSYSLMNSVYEEIEDYLVGQGYNVLRQGDRIGRTRILSDFKKSPGSVLFGVDSFWQGVDVQGEALSNVIITKLPFSVPDHPIVEARIEEIELRGGDAFLEYTLPEAVLKFKQGFGRLIRSKKDTGIIVVLDSRIINKSYGRHFLRSIPECEIIIERINLV